MKTILVPVDFSDATPPIAAAALSMANAFGSRVIFLNVLEPTPEFIGLETLPATVPPVIVRNEAAEQDRLEALAAKYSSVGSACHALQVQGSAVSTILKEARERGADLIVMGSHGHGSLYELLVGSVTHGVLKKAPCPVLIVPASSAKAATAPTASPTQ